MGTGDGGYPPEGSRSPGMPKVGAGGGNFSSVIKTFCHEVGKHLLSRNLFLLSGQTAREISPGRNIFHIKSSPGSNLAHLWGLYRGINGQVLLFPRGMSISPRGSFRERKGDHSVFM